MSASVRVYFKKKIEIQRLSFSQQDMLKLGTVGVGTILQRVRLGRGPTDGPAKPLTKGYARWKSRHGLIPRRDLWGSGGRVFLEAGSRRKKGKYGALGHMLDNLSVRTVSENTARIGLTLESARIKGLANERRESWMVFSPKNLAAIKEAWRRIFIEKKERLAKVVNISLRPAA